MSDQSDDPRSILSLIERLSKIEADASPPPWYVREVDDNLCMSAISVSTATDSVPGDDWLDRGEWEEDAVVAGCLVQSTLRAVHTDGRWFENALLIAEMRNHLPELLRLARIALATGPHNPAA